MAEPECEIPQFQPSDREIDRVLRDFSTIAVVGLSKNPEKPSHYVPRYLQDHGYRIIPVNPTAAEPLLGQPVFRKLSEAPPGVQVVTIFRPSPEVPSIVQEAVAIGAKAVWMQEGIIHNEAAKAARDAGLTVIMNRCMMKEHRRLRSGP